MPPQQIPLSRRSLDNASVLALLGTLFVVLLVFIPSVEVSLTTTKTFALAVGTLITLALYIVARLVRGNIIFPPSILLVALWLPVIAYGLSSVFSGITFSQALWGNALEPDTFGFMLVVACLGTLSALVVRRVEHYRAFFTASIYLFGISVALEILFIVVGQFAPNSISPNFLLLGTFENLASLLGLGVVSILLTLRFLEISARTYRMLVSIGTGALLLLAISNASLVWVLVALVSLGLFVESIMQRSSKSTDNDLDDSVVIDESPLEVNDGNHSLVFPLAVLVVSLFFLIGGTLGTALADTLNVHILNVRPSWQSTLSVAQQTYKTMPIFGSGPGTFGIEWLKHRDVALNSTVFWNVDFTSGIGFIPTSFVTTGIVGAIAWITFLVLLFVLGLRMLLLRTPKDVFVRYVAIVSFVGTLYLFALMLFTVPNAIVLACAFVFAGLFISTMRCAKGGVQWGVIFSRSPRMGFLIVFSLTILLLASIVATYALIERYMAVSMLADSTKALSSGNLDKAEKSVQNSIAFAPSVVAYQVQSAIASARLTSIVTSTTMDASTAQQEYQSALSAGITAATTATTLNPSDYQSWIALGNLYAQTVQLGITGAYEQAQSAYEKAVALNPTNPHIPYISAQLNIANKDTKAAQEDLKVAIALKQDYTAAIFLLSQLEVQDGNVKGALASALAAAYFTPNNPSILFQVGILYAAQNDLTNAIAALSAAVAANPQFANAHYFLSAVYAKKGDTENAIIHLKAIADMSSDNAKAVASQLATLKEGKNPFPANILTISSTSVQ